MSEKVVLLLAAVMATASAGEARDSSALPRHIGRCVVTQILKIETRLEDGDSHMPVPDSGSAVEFTNGGYQVSYDTVPAIAHSDIGDRVRMCLVKIPQHCPPGDDRGRWYKTTNLRTRQSWRLPDAEHMCGGA